LLSDAGPLRPNEIATLTRALQSAALDETAKVQIRIALARSSDLPAERFWDAGSPVTEFRRRGALLAARHLARRNPAPWNALRDQMGKLEPSLIAYLSSRIKAGP
jgi:hypothetical protein